MSQSIPRIMLSHGSGGKMMHQLIEQLFVRYFSNPILEQQTDAAILSTGTPDLAFTTDSFVIDPLFFPGGNIGKLAVCGTVNDLAVAGAEPLYLSVSMILEEGLPMADLETIVSALAEEARKAGVAIVTGDTKVVQKGKCDKIFINTAGIGRISNENRMIGQAIGIQAGDLILVNGTLGDHGMAIMNARESFHFKTNIESDCACLNHLIKKTTGHTKIKFMRDPTRGGVATVLNELAEKIGLGIELDEAAIPLTPGVKAICELLGFDPLQVANEGKVLFVVGADEGDKLLEILRTDPLGRESAIIGKVVEDYPGKVVLRNETGGRRIIDSLSGDQLPRIC